ncbi:MAG: hypothetical protein RPU34_06595 [Candidatus Sedimenticola sp. (ex Thyasira tokunagai)]
MSAAFTHLFNAEASANSAAGEGTAGGAVGGFGKWLGKLGRKLFGPLGTLLETDDIVRRNAYLNHYTTDLGREGIVYDGVIRRSPDGNVYLTPDLYSSGAQAQAQLSLSSTPVGYFSVPMSNIHSVSSHGVVDPWAGQPGGGYEVKVPHDVSTENSRWYPIGR